MSQLHKVKYDTRTTTFDPQEEKYWYHFLKGDPIIGHYIRGQARMNPTLSREIFNQHTCPHCEGFCFHDKNDTVRCMKCYKISPTSSTHTVKEHLRGGHYK